MAANEEPRKLEGKLQGVEHPEAPMTCVSDVKVGALIYTFGRSSISVLWIAPDGKRKHLDLARTQELTPKLDKLRHELRDTAAVASGRVPVLRDFARGWGRQLLPPAMLTSPPDVVVVVPHARLHDIPLHLIQANTDAEPIGYRVGFAYSVSMSAFVRAAERNPARTDRLDQWMFDETRAGAGHADAARRSFAGGGFDALLGETAAFDALAAGLRGWFRGETKLLRDPLGATRAGIKSAIELAPDVLCLVAHGYFDAKDHELSGLMVGRDHYLMGRVIRLPSGRRLEFRDLPLASIPLKIRTSEPAELLTAAELEIDVHICPHLVVLLACSAGAGQLRPGDTSASLAETFLHVGAPSVVAANWDIDYEFTKRWIEAFFDGWVGLSMPKALAVRHAMRITDEASPGEHPERVGALSLRGDWL